MIAVCSLQGDQDCNCAEGTKDVVIALNADLHLEVALDPAIHNMKKMVEFDAVVSVPRSSARAHAWTHVPRNNT